MNVVAIAIDGHVYQSNPCTSENQTDVTVQIVSDLTSAGINSNMYNIVIKTDQELHDYL